MTIIARPDHLDDAASCGTTCCVVRRVARRATRVPADGAARRADRRARAGCPPRSCRPPSMPPMPDVVRPWARSLLRDTEGLVQLAADVLERMPTPTHRRAPPMPSTGAGRRPGRSARSDDVIAMLGDADLLTMVLGTGRAGAGRHHHHHAARVPARLASATPSATSVRCRPAPRRLWPMRAPVPLRPAWRWASGARSLDRSSTSRTVGGLDRQMSVDEANALAAHFAETDPQRVAEVISQWIRADSTEEPQAQS